MLISSLSLRTQPESTAHSLCSYDTDTQANAALHMLPQSRGQSLHTDYTHISGLSLWTHQVNVGVGVTVDLSGVTGSMVAGTQPTAELHVPLD